VSRATTALLAFVAGVVFADWTRPEPVLHPASSGGTATAPKRACGGLWVRHESAKYRGTKQCVPSADLTKPRPVPNHILTMPIGVNQ
jgi:hypothetical protein